MSKDMSKLGENIYQMVKMKQYSLSDNATDVFIQELRSEFPDYVIQRVYGLHTRDYNQPKILIQVPVNSNKEIVKAFRDLRDFLRIQGGLKLIMSESFSYDKEHTEIDTLHTDDEHILFVLDMIEYKSNNVYKHSV